MRGIGTIVNVLAVLAGGGIGLILKGGMKQRYQDIMMQALGLATMFVGMVGALQGMLTIQDGGIRDYLPGHLCGSHGSRGITGGRAER